MKNERKDQMYIYIYYFWIDQVGNKFNCITMASKYLSIPVPDSLPQILDQLIKSVLRDQPKDIILYCADYFAFLEHGQMVKNHPELINQEVKKSVQATFNKYFVKKLNKISKEQVLPFMRFYSSTNDVQKQPIPNTIDLIMNLVKERKQFSKEQFIDTITEFFS